MYRFFSQDREGVNRQIQLHYKAAFHKCVPPNAEFLTDNQNTNKKKSMKHVYNVTKCCFN